MEEIWLRGTGKVVKVQALYYDGLFEQVMVSGCQEACIRVCWLAEKWFVAEVRAAYSTKQVMRLLKLRIRRPRCRDSGVMRLV